MPPAAPRREVVQVSGNHSLAGDIGALRAAVGEWLGGVIALRS
jgi:hypothetical protein